MTENTQATQEPGSNFTRLRALLFLVLTLMIGAVIIVLATWWVIGSAPRTVAVAVDSSVTVNEYITLPDDDSYPAALAIAEDGTLYTGSYASGTIWSISPSGVIDEVRETRDLIGSVTGLDVAPDGTLYILDRIVPLDTQGVVVWRYDADGLSSVVQIPNDPTIGVVLPDDIAVDNAGYLYITDRDPARIWRYSVDGINQGVWWTPAPSTSETQPAPTGLAYDRQNDAIVVTDSGLDRIYRIDAGSVDLQSAIDNTEILFTDTRDNGLGLDGITVSPSGDVYVALLSWNRVARLDGNILTTLAQEFRGSSDVAYDPDKDVLFVTNWNQFSLGFGTSPQLPFALDKVDLSPENNDE